MTADATVRDHDLVRLARSLCAGAPARVAGLVLLTVALGSVEGLGLLLLVPLLGLAGLDVGAAALGPLEEAVAAAFAAVGLAPTLPTVLAAYVLLVAGHGLLRWRAEVRAGEMEQAFVSRLRKDLFAALRRASWTHLCRVRSSDVAHALTTEAPRAGAAAHGLVLLAADTLAAGAYAAFALVLSPLLGLGALAAAAAVALLLRRLAASPRSEGEAASRAGAALEAQLSEGVDGARTGRTLGADARDTERFAYLSDAHAGEVGRARASHVSSRVLGQVAVAALVALAAFAALGPLALAPARVLLLLFVAQRLVLRVLHLESALRWVETDAPAHASLVALRRRLAAAAEPPGARGPARPLAEGVEVRAARFAWPGAGGAAALDGVSLRLPARGRTAVVGPSGAGKSTLADAVAGMVPLDGGEILVDGVPLAAADLPAWRESVGYVTQDVFLLRDSLRANLLWARPDATEAEMADCLAAAGAADLAARLPRGLDTELGDRGALLSAGERQRVALARALLRRPTLLVLDDATAHLDPEAESRILATLDALRERVTILQCATRMSSVLGADRVVALAGGKVTCRSYWDAPERSATAAPAAPAESRP